MSGLAIYGDRRMTVREVAEVFGVSERVVQLSVKRLFPDAVQNGKLTLLDEAMATAVKRDLQGHHNLEGTFEVATTALEIEEMTLKVIAYHKAEAERLREELAAAAPKIACANALMASDRTMSITDAAKHFSLHPKLEVFPYLRARGYLTRDSLPTQAAIDAGYLSLKEVRAQDGKVWPQAVVEAWQLENWRAHVVCQIKKWVREGAVA